ncbi:protein tyrosine phosphatase domain-containing protein 1-like isoform X1 [Entelurus aequoreus]|uniref:protein tyrosine phosphatase domain-containing protein 1-like isoform X1 n=1 Tax=Entelurus aequoreus TaxID=161455 RepID=UPI002B1D3FCD|nr:protein tyrosine phosphatase domain-containing protein 1-like isoform X1 [Entelurus aequoreus]
MCVCTLLHRPYVYFALPVHWTHSCQSSRQSRMQTLTQHVPFPRAAYSQARENLVKAIPPKLLCLLACGGLDCRYEGPDCWKASQQVIRGIFSSWVTDDIIAMARPSTILIEKFDVIEQFQRLNIRSIINMQVPGEHAHCGPPLDPGSGFTYLPQIFMENDSETFLDTTSCSRAFISLTCTIQSMFIYIALNHKCLKELYKPQRHPRYRAHIRARKTHPSGTSM